ncbi:hypothetical protein C7M84_002066 [Penaeus vannamei]|uniref:Uncharacterized protein n=1 Tax=Penaeus vannamei TaxID=6689 RepID=A0A3R7PWE6_PENVA|nr:hypothetical protein C7M84_002066 [Penaeus vannamei]
MRAFWGLEALPENASPLVSSGTSSSGQGALGGKETNEPRRLPPNRFLDHVNQVYFNGQLDLDKKAFLGNSFRLGILNGDGDVTYPSGARRRKPKGYPPYLRKEKAKRREEGREEMPQKEGRGEEVNYVGPRSVNRMQYELDDF